MSRFLGPRWKSNDNILFFQATWNKLQETLANNEMSHQSIPSKAVSHIEDALHEVKQRTSQDCEVQVYVTGSLHLVGGVLSFIHPNFHEKTPNELKEESILIQQYSSISKNDE